MRRSLNNSEVNNFVNDSEDDAPVDHEGPRKARKLTDNTMQQTPNMEKRDLEPPENSVSSEESKENIENASFVCNFSRIILV